MCACDPKPAHMHALFPAIFADTRGVRAAGAPGEQLTSAGQARLKNERGRPFQRMILSLITSLLSVSLTHKRARLYSPRPTHHTRAHQRESETPTHTTHNTPIAPTPALSRACGRAKIHRRVRSH